MKKLFTLAAAVLASFSLWAATESNPTSSVSSNAEVSGTSYTIDGTYVAGLGGTKAGDMTTKGIKFRLNRTAGELSNAVEFKVNEGYVITKIDFCGHVNDNSKTSTIKQVLVDGVDINAAPVDLPAKTSSASFSYTINATESFIMVFEGSGTQANIEYTITYEEAVQKEVDHVDVTLGGVAVNGEALSDIQMATLYGAQSLELANEYVEAPTVTFTVQTDTYYVGEETPSTKSEGIDVEAEFAAGKWQAQYTIGEQTYTITAVKPATATVTYMDGETVLGTEIVKVGESATKYGEYEVKPLAEFQGWYTDAELTSEADLSATVGADMVLYGKFVKAYAQSIDFEQMVLNQGKSYDVKSALTANFYDYKNIDALDSLNNSKGAARNEPYLGLKIKKQGGSLACNVLPGTTIRIKFGYVAETVLAIAGNDTMLLNPTDNKIANLEFPIMVETTVKLQTTSDKTVVIKQIMIDEPLVTWMYPITYAPAENGKVEGWTIAFPYEEVKVTPTPAEGYKTVSLTCNGIALHDEEVGYVTFTMPAEAVQVVAQFATEFPTAIDNTEAEVKAVKVVENGQMFILKGGVKYNAQGAVVK
ncbi:MAG: hypothetical protein J6M55_06405 [Paludibacteraceae bacterium]|nr:hypothetical protein [Paludibacteraceae bacterium]